MKAIRKWTPGPRRNETREFPPANMIAHQAKHLDDVTFHARDDGELCPSSPKLTEWYVKAYLNANKNYTGLKS